VKAAVEQAAAEAAKEQEKAKQSTEEKTRKIVAELGMVKEQLTKEKAHRKQADDDQKKSDLDAVVASYLELHSQSIAGPEVLPQWRGWQFVLHHFQTQPPPDPWALADCDGVLELEQQLEQAQAQVGVSPQHMDTRDRLRGALASKVACLLGESDESSHLGHWSSVLDQHVGDLAASDVEQSADAVGLVHSALQEIQRWEQECSTQLGEVYRASEVACSELAIVLRDLASALLGQSAPADRLLRPKVANLRAVLDAEVEARANASNLLRSWPQQSVVAALHAIQASVSARLTRSQSMAAMQERLGAMLPALQAQRPDPGVIQQLDAQLKKLKRKTESLTVEVRHCKEDVDVEGAKQAEQELHQTRAELIRVVKECQQYHASALALVCQFPELLLPDSPHFLQSLKQMLESNGLEVGFKSINIFRDREIIASQDTRHTVYKARLEDDWFSAYSALAKNNYSLHVRCLFSSFILLLVYLSAPCLAISNAL
jgi:hypothetical protein